MTTILIVEDNELNRDMLSRRLIRRGYDVIQAVNGEQGVSMALENLPDIVLMDLSLPILDGWNATARIREAAKGSDVPIIALTAHALPEDKARATEAGCNDYATKPIDIDSLLDKIQGLLPV